MLDNLESNLMEHPNELAEMYFQNKTKIKRSNILSFCTARQKIYNEVMRANKDKRNEGLTANQNFLETLKTGVIKSDPSLAKKIY